MRRALACSLLLLASVVHAEPKKLTTGAFAIDVPVTLPGTPDEIFGAVTGDVSGWWDHSFSGKPRHFYLEAKVGGGFMEVFDDAGNGVRHAVVTYVDRPKVIRFEGPLGLAGNAIQAVWTYELVAAGSDSTTLTLHGRCSGQMEDAWPALVEKAWHHFLIEQFKPWVESGKHKQRSQQSR